MSNVEHCTSFIIMMVGAPLSFSSASLWTQNVRHLENRMSVTVQSCRVVCCDVDLFSAGARIFTPQKSTPSFSHA
jgi:hypothetical protein